MAGVMGAGICEPHTDTAVLQLLECAEGRAPLLSNEGNHVDAWGSVVVPVGSLMLDVLLHSLMMILGTMSLP